MSEKGYNIVQVKNTWHDKAAYKGVNVKIQNPDGQKFELQFHTAESFAAKQQIHPLFEEMRKLPKGSEEYMRLYDEMKELTRDLEFPKNISQLK